MSAILDLSNANPACGHKEVRRSTGGHIVVITRYSDQQGSKSRQKSYAILQAMAPANVKTVHQTSLLHIESNLDRLGLLSPTHGQRSQQQSGQITLQPVLINKSKLLKATHRRVVVFSSHSFWTSSSLDVPAGVTQEEGHTRFLIHLLSAVHALIFLARRIQPLWVLYKEKIERI